MAKEDKETKAPDSMEISSPRTAEKPRPRMSKEQDGCCLQMLK
ncbi:hypothetical protein [Salegentibacter salegens]|nr:hypothetical protein [Salegentibacter salegens]